MLVPLLAGIRIGNKTAKLIQNHPQERQFKFREHAPAVKYKDTQCVSIERETFHRTC